MNSELNWSQNYIFNGEEKQRECRGRSKALKGFRKINIQDDIDLHKTGFPMAFLNLLNEGEFVLKAI